MSKVEIDIKVFRDKEADINTSNINEQLNILYHGCNAILKAMAGAGPKVVQGDAGPESLKLFTEEVQALTAIIKRMEEHGDKHGKGDKDATDETTFAA